MGQVYHNDDKSGSLRLLLYNKGVLWDDLPLRFYLIRGNSCQFVAKKLFFVVNKSLPGWRLRLGHRLASILR